jgi:folate-binding protein YgfZ
MVSNDVSTSPFLDYFVSLGFSVDQSNGRKVIKSFSSPESEVNSLYDGVGFVDLSSNGILEMRGKDVLDFLHRISTNSLRGLQKEDVGKTLFISEKGRMIDFSYILNFDDYQVLICSGVNKSKVRNWVEKYIIADDVRVIDTPGKYVLFSLVGPQADSFLSFICGNVVSNIQPYHFRIISSEGMMFFAAKLIDRKGNPNFLILADYINGQKFISWLHQYKGPFDFNFIGDVAWNSYRIEQGIPEAPYEINDQFNPHEINLLDMVSFNKGCYIGQEVIARLRTHDKVQKQLFGVVFPEPVGNNESFSLFDDDGNNVGIITSSSYSFKCKQYIGLCIVRKSFASPDICLIAKNEMKTMTVKLNPIPFRK